MKNYSDFELQKVLDGLNEGKTYCGITKNGFGVGEIYKTTCGNIGWRHAGESANRFSLRDLRWLLEVIFWDCESICEAKYDSKYLNYIPVDSQYKGINFNIRGL